MNWMGTIPYPLCIPNGQVELAEIGSRAERSDKTAALRQLLHAGAEECGLSLIAEVHVSA